MTSTDTAHQGDLFRPPPVCHLCGSLGFARDRLGRDICNRHRDEHRGDDRPTAVEAGRRADRSPSSELSQLVLAELRRAGYRGCTDDEIQARHPEQHPGSLSKRRRDLETAGLVMATDATRLTRRGRRATVYQASAWPPGAPPFQRPTPPTGAEGVERIAGQRDRNQDISSLRQGRGRS